ncbi:MAG: type I polyketide synthase [Thermoanaerobaculia bacterium]
MSSPSSPHSFGEDFAPEPRDPSNQVAILAMSGRFPGASSVEELWSVLERGEEAIASFSDEELRAAGVEEATLRNPRYVRRAGILEGIDRFDATFFGYSPAEATRLDPQQRLFLECSWEAFEEAGYDVRRLDVPVGVFAATSANSYFFYYFFSRRELLNTPGAAGALIGGDKDFLALRVSYELGLRGPGITVQTACSSSLVAVHLACQSLLGGECDMAIAGGVSVRVPQTIGYFHQTEGILSPEGRCRAYDAEARGAVMGSGLATLVLKRYEDALADGDPIRAVLLGSAVNNDGRARVGFTAPGVEGQAAVIGDALAMAGVDPSTIGFVEGHGSGTAVGDPIEVAALNEAFPSSELPPKSCALGSIKTNLGHLDAAAGAAGLVKAVLAVERGKVPASLHFETPNPQIDFDGGPFYVPARTTPWPGPEGRPRRAGVSSFGLGGTNAHVVIEEPPSRAVPSGGDDSDGPQLLVLSAATPAALERSSERLRTWLEDHPEANVADVAYTLQVARAVLPYRWTAVCREREEAIARLDPERDGGRFGAFEDRLHRPVAFLLPGLGEDFPGMGGELYEADETFRETIDRCADVVRRETGTDVKPALLAVAGGDAPSGSSASLDLRAFVGRSREALEVLPASVSQPALFALEYALAALWRRWGVEPEALLGYSLGEYVAACLAGVLPLEQALWLVARRAERIGELPPGAMVAVALPEAAAARRFAPHLTVAAVNGPELTVLAGPPEAVATAAEELQRDGVACRRLATDRAYHTAAMASAGEAVGRLFEQVDLAPPRVPFLSNLTGTWIQAAEATDPAYWVQQLERPVRFSSCLAALEAGPDRVLLEVGPGSSLASLAIQAADGTGGTGARPAVPSLPGRHERTGAADHLVTAAGRLWLAGVSLHWQGLHGSRARRRLGLPTYPFERERYWPEGVGGTEATAGEGEAPRISVPAHGRPALSAEDEARSPLEQAVAEIWAEVLGLDRVGVRENFFELGGHSLLATQMLAQVRERLGQELALEDLFSSPTVAELADRLVAREAEGFADQDLDELLAEIDGLEEDEVDAMLRKGEGDGSR